MKKSTHTRCYLSWGFLLAIEKRVQDNSSIIGGWASSSLCYQQLSQIQAQLFSNMVEMFFNFLLPRSPKNVKCSHSQKHFDSLHPKPWKLVLLVEFFRCVYKLVLFLWFQYQNINVLTQSTCVFPIMKYLHDTCTFKIYINNSLWY